MKTQFNRRGALTRIGAMIAGVLALPVARQAKAAVTNLLADSGAPKDYVPTDHKWLMCIDATKCIGCGLCAEACKKENDVPQGPYYRTWIERYIITKPKSGSAETSGEIMVDSPEGGMHGFPECPVPKDQIQQSFFVPKLCNLCENPPCVQVCPVGATFQAPDGAVLVDKNYCIGCAFCVQACPYGARFLNPVTHTADKCTLCYHRTTRGLKPACVEICPAQARIFGDLKHLSPDDPLQKFYETNRTQVLKPHLGTEPRVLYAGLDKEVR
jgi:tetrathionate reductase subunit B